MRRVVIVACGTAHHAGLIGRYAIEQWARIPVENDVASEYRYRNPVVGPDDLVIGISQSGETADTLAAMRTARAGGAKVLAMTNVMGAQATREADGVLYTRAGLEIGVAATKTFVSQITAMYLIALRLAEVRGTMDRAELKPPISDLKRLPHLIAELLERDVSGIEAIAESVYTGPFFLYLGRHIGLPVALEGALKLKEISYIATDAYAAGEMKHGPIALLDENTPVVVVATRSPVLEKVISNIQEVRARGARVIAIATEGDDEITEHADEIIRVPETNWLLAPLLAVIPLQLLAYSIARKRGLNVDQPRNLAKTVTVMRWTPARHRRAAMARRTSMGIDLLEIDRLAQALARRPRLAERLFTDGERAYAAARGRPAEHLAARFCAKEAVAKALGMTAWSFRDVEVLATDGRPGGRAARRHRRPRRAARGRSVGVAHPHPRAGGRDRAGPARVRRVTGLPDWLAPLPDAGQQRATDEWAIETRSIPGLELMERAGSGLTELVCERVPDGAVVVICGKGNNGGDGLVVARQLRERGRRTEVLLLADPGEYRGDAAANLERLPGPPPRPFTATALDGGRRSGRRDPRYRVHGRAPRACRGCDRGRQRRRRGRRGRDRV